MLTNLIKLTAWKLHKFCGLKQIQAFQTQILHKTINCHADLNQETSKAFRYLWHQHMFVALFKHLIKGEKEIALWRVDCLFLE